MDKTELMEAGLGKSEADIYLALLRLGKSTVTTITQDTGIHRTYIYDVLEKLKEKGLVSEIKEKNKKYFQAAEPNRIKEYLLEKIQRVEVLIPKLEEIRNKEGTETEVQVFKGKEGMKTILNDIIKGKSDYYALGSVKEFEDILPIYAKQFLKRVDKHKIKEKVILSEGIKILGAKKHEYRYLPKEYLLLTGVIIYADKVAFFIWNKPYIQILIRNKNIVESYLTQFNLLWKQAKN